MAAINLSAFLAGKVRAAGEQLTAAVEKMPEERLLWKPTCEGNTGRDALDQALECAYLNEWVAAGYRSGTMPPLDWDDYKVRTNAKRNKADVVAWLRRSTDALIGSLNAFTVSSRTQDRRREVKVRMLL